MKHLLTLCIGFFMLLSCNNKPSQSAAIATDEPEVNEDTLFRVIDLANNLKPCSDSLLLSDIVEDVEYVKLETADNGLVGAMNRGYVSDSAIFYSSSGNTTPPPHIFMFDRFTGKF
ncbi:6-bladed beta-propeller, partial [Bacteroides sp. AM16-15]